MSVDVAADVAKNGVDQGNIKADTHEQKYDLKAPTVESVSVKGTEGDGTTDKTVGLGIGDKIVVTLDMSEVIVLTEATSGTTAYTINFDGTNKQATYDTALNTANSNKMVFSYTIVAGDTNVAGGVQLNAGTIALTGGDTLTDIAGNAAVLNTPTVKGSSRYVLIKQDGTSQQMFIGEVEVMVDGVNVALGKTVTSDAALIHYDNWTPAKIVDGKNGTSEGMATSSAQTDGWVQIDLGQDYKIDNIVVKAVGGGTSAYDRSRVGNFSIFTSSLDYSGSTLSELTANRAVYKVGTTAASAVQTLGVNVPNNDIVIDTTPLTIDLNHDGVVEYTSLSESVAYYDVDGDGKKEHTAWVASQDGLIGFDANSDGKISGREELVLSDYVKGAKTDLEGMAYFDSNQDGNFTQDDKHWADFKVWQDKDGDGISDAGELRTLDEVGISKIELTSDNNKQTLANGDVTEYGQFKIHYTDDTQGIGGDSAFAYQNADKDTVLVTTSENSVLQGNDNADTFVFNYEGVAKVLDFNVLQGDKLDFSNLFDVGDEYNLADFFSINDDGKDVYLVVDIHGTGNFDRPELDVILSGIGTGSVELEALQDSLIVL
ncbi:MAG: discoidin domain-containing protein [Candidatus Thiodubiliella endoseptemdiera]|uniref:Discoidin domain-containing protein n=1 Tax=Candidatus Thiodubiliella endoseptemdiera TaxID=2738886 RepID=A0A853EZ11_9GAMM|nr:discoidin domain-containing protein [Candidatus Thiodubiliella endoseptemdiera]